MNKSIYHRLTGSFFVAFFIALTMFPCGSSYAEEKTQFTLDDCIKAALASNLGLRGSDISTLSSELDFQVARSFFDPSFSANLANSITRRGGISLESQISGGSKSEFMSGDFEFSQQLFSGARWSVKYQADRSKADSVFTEGVPSTAYASQTSLTYTHPLLEGSDTSVNKIGLLSSKIRNEQQQLLRENQARELVYQVKAGYYDILNSRESINVAELSLAEAENLLEFVKAQLEVGLVSSYEILSAESGLALREENLLMAKTDYLNNLDNLKNLMSFPLEKEIEIVGELKSIEIKPMDYDSILQLARENRPDLKQLHDSIELSKLDIKMNSDLVKASLALVGQVGVQGEDLNLSGAIGDMNNLSWYLGLNYTVPLGGNRKANAELKQAQFRLQEAQLALEDKLSSISLEITRALRNLETAKNRLDVTLQGVELQEYKLKMEKERLELGLITSKDLLDFEEDLASARLRYLNARADYLKSVSYLEYVTHSERENFTSKESEQP